MISINKKNLAPLSAVGGINSGDPAKSGRAFIPDTYLIPRKVLKNRYIRTDIDPAGNPIPIFEYYEETQTDKVPKDWTSCHQIANYGWIFEIVNPQTPGYVIPK
mgnify:FL=1